MRAISLVNSLELDFQGNVLKNAVKLGDVDNDGHNELVVGNDAGEVAVFKGADKKQTMKDVGFVSCLDVGDVLNEKCNCLVVIGADGWCYIYAHTPEHTPKKAKNDSEGTEEVDGAIFSSAKKLLGPEDPQFSSSTEKDVDNYLELIHSQRIPANTKDILLADVDGDGLVEMVLGLTDRIVRSYRWRSSKLNESDPNNSSKLLGKLICLNKWECANQIGSITLHHGTDGSPALLIAQPGGTFMRIRCLPDEKLPPDSEIENQSNSPNESLPGSTIDYQFLGLSRMRNQNISTEIVGDLQVSSSARPYSLATLDGTIMLVNEELILWAMAVDHQVFVLNKLDVTGDGQDDIIACAWDGQTYILDQDRNAVRFQLDEAVQAFTSGSYTLEDDEKAVACFVYVTFREKILLYFDVRLKEMVLKKFEPKLEGLLEGELDRAAKKQLVEYLLYGVNK